MDLHSNSHNSGLKKRKQDENQDALVSGDGNSMSIGESSGSGGDPCKSLTSISMDSNNSNGCNSDISCHDDDEDANDDDDPIDDDANDDDDPIDDDANDDDDPIDDDALEDPDYDSDYYDDDIYEDDYSFMQDQFDNADLPPGVEASLPWLKDIASSDSKPAVSHVIPESSSKETLDESDTVMQKFRQFKQFDTVDCIPDHHYDRKSASTSESQRPKNWAKKIQEEWKILEENLPETIFVRVCESRMEFLRAVIIGPQGTPYHDGLFFFDCLFPSNYPAVPPQVYYHSGGLRLNPNLYNCGKVCLSLLGTWHGKNSENWIADKSTMLQVLVSIQALILNEKPFFNEPGFAEHYRAEEGQRRSKEYNDNTFVLSLKTMMYTLRKPPKHFEDFVAGHFRLKARDILTACRAYAEGGPVGSVLHNAGQSSRSAPATNQKEFQSAVSRMMNTLIAFFTKNGSTNCEDFRSQELYSLSAAATVNLETFKIESAGTKLTQVGSYGVNEV
ncbi:unnamed protein product [Trifolium pratense]|uniref:Uncharacterized protein n=1 Tax=Trifolium pratense TaxID=57577 RepID=A0ACB0MB43_TRIPR|nr:unnamed protein product [Trifolium pratense]